MLASRRRGFLLDPRLKTHCVRFSDLFSFTFFHRGQFEAFSVKTVLSVRFQALLKIKWFCILEIRRLCFSVFYLVIISELLFLQDLQKVLQIIFI